MKGGFAIQGIGGGGIPVFYSNILFILHPLLNWIFTIQLCLNMVINDK